MGYPNFGVSKTDHPSTAYHPFLSLQNHFLLEKCECLQKTRAQTVKIGPRYKGFMRGKKSFQNFLFLPAENEKQCKSVSFQDILWSVSTPLFYM